MKTFKKIGIKSFVKFNVYYMGIIGIITGLFTGLPVLLFGQAASNFGDGQFGAGMGAGFGIGMLIGTPLVYAFFGLIFGYIGGFIINLILKLSGGIDIEFGDGIVEEAEVANAEPVVEEKA